MHAAESPVREQAILDASENPFTYLVEYDGTSLLVATPDRPSGRTADAMFAAAQAVFAAVIATSPRLATLA